MKRVGEWLVIMIADKLVLEANIGSTNKLGFKNTDFKCSMNVSVCYSRRLSGGSGKKRQVIQLFNRWMGEAEKTKQNVNK